VAPSAGPDARASPPLVSVIVPVFGLAPGLGPCLERLARQTYPRERLETIVVDNGWLRPAAALARRAGARRVREARPGSFAARNAGLLVARGEILAFTDADCLPHADWIERGVEALERPGASGVVAGPIEVVAPRPPGASPTAYLYDVLFNYATTAEQRAGGYAVTANLLVRRSVFDAVGPFDADFLSGGDVEWGRRAAAAGFRAEWAPGVRVGHQARGTIREIVLRALRLAGGNQMNRERELPPGLLRMLREIFLVEIRGHIAWRLKVLRSPRAEAPRALRAQVAALVLLVQTLRAAERVRVYLGGAPRRA
jgi:GT2 family glycosyltransferase